MYGMFVKLKHIGPDRLTLAAELGRIRGKLESLRAEVSLRIIPLQVGIDSTFIQLDNLVYNYSQHPSGQYHAQRLLKSIIEIRDFVGQLRS